MRLPLDALRLLDAIDRKGSFAADAARLIGKQTAEPGLETPHNLAWRTAHRGKALQWLTARLQQPKTLEQ